ALSPRYLQRVRDYVHEAGGLLIADEVQAGFGRAGVWWGHVLSDVTPDILTLGKPMAAGYPMAGVVARGDLLDNFRKGEMYFNTFAGNPTACVVAKAVIEILDREQPWRPRKPSDFRR
ncbi:MAG: aminotransferase class III-fold pyridoxal phosphate-dependent enzyme, partial [Pseudomonadota bacterium]